jgi:hypothetical protein
MTGFLANFVIAHPGGLFDWWCPRRQSDFSIFIDVTRAGFAISDLWTNKTWTTFWSRNDNEE